MTQNSSQLGHHKERRTVRHVSIARHWRLIVPDVEGFHTSSTDELRRDLRDHVSATLSVSNQHLGQSRSRNSHRPHRREHLIFIADNVEIFFHARDVSIAYMQHLCQCLPTLFLWFRELNLTQLTDVVRVQVLAKVRETCPCQDEEVDFVNEPSLLRRSIERIPKDFADASLQWLLLCERALGRCFC